MSAWLQTDLDLAVSKHKTVDTVSYVRSYGILKNNEKVCLLSKWVN